MQGNLTSTTMNVTKNLKWIKTLNKKNKKRNRVYNFQTNKAAKTPKELGLKTCKYIEIR